MDAIPPPEILGLLGDPLRWQLVVELGRSDRRVGELVGLLGRPQNVVSYHLGELRKAGLVAARRSSADGRDMYYRVDLLRCRDLLGQVSSLLHPALSLQPSEDHTVAAPRRDRPRVLFLCTGNSARSQMAEALVEHRSAGTVEARSAGSHPKPLHPEAVRAMAGQGIDISGCASKSLTRFARTRFTRVVTLCDRVREICPEFPGAPVRAHWSLGDPAASGAGGGVPSEAFRQAADDIGARVDLLLADLRSNAA